MAEVPEAAEAAECPEEAAEAAAFPVVPVREAAVEVLRAAAAVTRTTVFHPAVWGRVSLCGAEWECPEVWEECRWEGLLSAAECRRWAEAVWAALCRSVPLSLCSSS